MHWTVTSRGNHTVDVCTVLAVKMCTKSNEHSMYIRFLWFYLISFEVLGPLHRAEALRGLQERLEEAILEFDRVLGPML